MQRYLATLAAAADEDLRIVVSGQRVQFQLYAALRREQRAIVAASQPRVSEPIAIQAFANSAFGELATLLSGREVLDSARDGEWSLRDLLRHAIAVELRYREQVLWSANRAEADPVAIPPARLPCDRLSPPVPEFEEALTGPVERVLQLFGAARAATDDALAGPCSAALERPSLWGDAQVDVRERLHQIGVHIIEVVLQAEKMLGSTESEARRIMRRISAARGLHQDLSSSRELAALDEALADLAGQIGH
jgi:DinB family protein